MSDRVPLTTVAAGQERSRMNPPAVLLEALSVGYEGRAVLSDVSGRFVPGSLTAIVGPNGGGKSTLAKAIAGVLAPLSGAVRAGTNGSGMVGYLAQQAELERNFPITVFDMVALGLWRDIGGFKGLGGVHRARVEAALDRVGLRALAARDIGVLSGGQFQRVLFARLIAQDAPVVLLDEPFTAMDRETTAELMRLVARWHGEGRTVIVVLHNVAMVQAFFPETLIVEGRVVAWGPTREVLAEHDHAAIEHGMDAETMRQYSDLLAGRRDGSTGLG